MDDERKVNEFIATISKPRLSRYLQETNGNDREALLLYHWNSQLSQSLYLVLQNWEIALRNRINAFLCYKYNQNWPFDQRAMRNLTPKDQTRLQAAIDRQRLQRRGGNPSTNHIVADLSAGFWVSQLGKKYDIPYIWRNNLKFRVFTNNKILKREEASQICDELLKLRNRIAHHEPFFHLELDLLRRKVELIVNSMCGSSADYMASACSFAGIWSNRPATGSTGKGQMTLGQV